MIVKGQINYNVGLDIFKTGAPRFTSKRNREQKTKRYKHYQKIKFQLLLAGLLALCFKLNNKNTAFVR